MLLQNDIKKVIISLFPGCEGRHPKADWSNGSWLRAAWQELKVQKSTYRIEKFVTESVRKSLSQAIKPHERPSAPPMGSGPRCLVNLNLPAFVRAPPWTMSWLQSWAAAGREEEWKGHEEGSRKKTGSAALPTTHMDAKGGKNETSPSSLNQKGSENSSSFSHLCADAEGNWDGEL